MTRQQTKREKDLTARSTAIGAAIRALDMEWPAQRREELGMTEQGRALVWIYEHDRKALLGAQAILDAMMADAESFRSLYALAAIDLTAFQELGEKAQAIVNQKAQVAA
ncbi:MAG: hypothetical protein ACOH2M_03270 [Cypionkella sp.]